VNDGKGGTASDTVTIQVTSPAPVVQLNFEDIYFDFDRSTLRPEALRLLDDAVTRLQANPTRNIIIEGHTCSIGTAEYNLALGDRRANSVRTYLISRGVPAARPDGLGALVAGSVRPVVPAAATAATLAAAAAAVAISATVTGGALGWTLPLAVAAGLAAAFAVQRHAVRRLGGITGDVLGAVAEIATTVTLVVAAMGPPA